MGRLSGMTTLGLRAVRSDLSHLVRRAAAGERIVVTVDGRPVAQLGPLGDGVPDTMADLIRRGLLRPAVRRGALDPSAVAVPTGFRLDRLLAEVRGR